MKTQSIKAGSLVTVLPAAIGFYIVLSVDEVADAILCDTATGYISPMNARWIKILSE